MSAILFTSARPRNRNRIFGLGVFVQKPARLPVGPSDADRLWAAANLNAVADPTDEETREYHEMMTLTRDEYRDLEWAQEEFRAQMRCEGHHWPEAEVSRCHGSRVVMAEGGGR